ncbi:MAG: MFS transporter [Actinomycetota bacterium]
MITTVLQAARVCGARRVEEGRKATLRLRPRVPLGTALGQAAGWRTALAVLALAGAARSAALLHLLPRCPRLPTDRASGAGTRIRTAVAVLASRAIVHVCAVTTLLVVGQFAAYTSIAPIVRRNGGRDGLTLSALLLGYGVAGMVRNVLVGRVVDRRPGTVLSGSILPMAAALIALTVTHGAPATILAVLAWGAGFTAVPVCLQAAVLRVAPHAQDAASAVYVVAFQIGIGGGALLGQRLFTAARLADLLLLAAVVALLSAAIAFTARRSFPLRHVHGDAARSRPAAAVR